MTKTITTRDPKEIRALQMCAEKRVPYVIGTSCYRARVIGEFVRNGVIVEITADLVEVPCLPGDGGPA
ncbi:MAG TPA: hypothetical protein VNT60_10725 [Deinococcales bacterium]|nr:hypothetical protein [Deinococcales bacterium]